MRTHTRFFIVLLPLLTIATSLPALAKKDPPADGGKTGPSARRVTIDAPTTTTTAAAALQPQTAASSSSSSSTTAAVPPKKKCSLKCCMADTVAVAQIVEPFVVAGLDIAGKHDAAKLVHDGVQVADDLNAGIQSGDVINTVGKLGADASTIAGDAGRPDIGTRITTTTTTVTNMAPAIVTAVENHDAGAVVNTTTMLGASILQQVAQQQLARQVQQDGAAAAAAVSAIQHDHADPGEVLVDVDAAATEITTNALNATGNTAAAAVVSTISAAVPTVVSDLQTGNTASAVGALGQTTAAVLSQVGQQPAAQLVLDGTQAMHVVLSTSPSTNPSQTTQQLLTIAAAMATQMGHSAVADNLTTMAAAVVQNAASSNAAV